MSEISRAQWNGTVRLHRPDPGHRAFGFCFCNQDTKERYWGQQFVKWKGIFRTNWPKLPDRSQWTTFKAGPEYSGRTKPSRSVPFDIPTEIGRILGWMESTLEFLSSKTLMTITDCTWSIQENILPFVIFHPMKALGELMLPLKSLSPNQLTQKLHQLLFHHYYDNVVTVIIITVSITFIITTPLYYNHYH